MKKAFGIFTIAAVMVACNSAPKTADMTATQPVPAITTDTAGLAQFQAWKAQNELALMNQYMNPEAPVAAAAPTVRRSGGATSTRSTSTARRSGSGTSGSAGSTSTASAKKGWSKAAKGAVIGGVAGGAAGAVINKKNRVAGGVIGAVIGAGGGYVIGRQMDKRDGRN
ncbi:MAG TPA: glycine zipper 2TM domain-containing protein [Flavisolibacter sp.]